MSDMETVIGYIDRINVLIKWMTTAKYKFKPAWSIHFILHSLPPSYTGIATIIQAQAKATLVYTWTALLQHKSSTLNNISSNSLTDPHHRRSTTRQPTPAGEDEEAVPQQACLDSSTEEAVEESGGGWTWTRMGELQFAHAVHAVRLDDDRLYVAAGNELHVMGV